MHRDGFWRYAPPSARSSIPVVADDVHSGPGTRQSSTRVIYQSSASLADHRPASTVRPVGETVGRRSCASVPKASYRIVILDSAAAAPPRRKESSD